MELIPAKTNIDFMRLRHLSVGVSTVLILVSLWAWFATGAEKYSVDFVGGTEVVVQFREPMRIGDIRTALANAGVTGAVVQSFEEGTNDFAIRLKSDFLPEDGAAVQTAEAGTAEAGTAEADTGEARRADQAAVTIREALGAIEDNSFILLKQDYVGPIIGEQIRKDGLTALVVALASILVYISFRFEWRFAVGAIAALAHDVTITAGLFVFSGREISAAVLAALLTIIGYSLNDTIVIFDRVRENLGLWQKKERGKKKDEPSRKDWTLTQLLNVSINETLGRTVITSLTTLLVVTTLRILGGGAVEDLAYALVIGVIVGTYSTIFVACPVVHALAPEAAAKYAEKTVGGGGPRNTAEPAI